MIRDEGVAAYFKDPVIEDILDAANEALSPLEERLTAGFDGPKHPVILVMGPPRSGTTLLLQLLIACFRVGYVNNLTARFWRAPYMGALIARDLGRRRSPSDPDFTSELGATSGYEGPHEFGFFWQRWFPSEDTHQTPPELLASRDFGVLRREIAALEAAFGAPIVFKNPIVFNLHIEALAEALPTSLFIVCKRSPIYIAQSLLQSRVKRYGNRESWLGVKPKEYLWLKELSPIEQVAGQVYYTEERIQQGLSGLPPDRYLSIEYGSLCQEPMREVSRIADAVKKRNASLEETGYRPSQGFASANRKRIGDAEWQEMQVALERFYKGDGPDRQADTNRLGPEV